VVSEDIQKMTLFKAEPFVNSLPGTPNLSLRCDAPGMDLRPGEIDRDGYAV
jgi:hypothetical protein